MKWKCLSCPWKMVKEGTRARWSEHGAKSFTKVIENVLEDINNAVVASSVWRDYSRISHHKSGLINIHGDDRALESHEITRKMKQEWRIRSLRTITQIKVKILFSIPWPEPIFRSRIHWRRSDQVPRKEGPFGTVVRIYGDSYPSLSPKGLMTTYSRWGKGNNQIYWRLMGRIGGRRRGWDG